MCKGISLFTRCLPMSIYIIIMREKMKKWSKVISHQNIYDLKLLKLQFIQIYKKNNSGDDGDNNN